MHFVLRYFYHIHFSKKFHPPCTDLNYISMITGVNNLKEAANGKGNSDLSVNTSGFGFGVFVPVLKPLWIGFAYQNSAYYKLSEEYGISYMNYLSVGMDSTKRVD